MTTIENPSEQRLGIVLDYSNDGSDAAGDLAMEESRARTAEIDAFRIDALSGLAQQQRSIPSKYLYDAVGAKLFEDITRQPEYYPTRTEIELLKKHAGEIAEEVGPGATIVEPGSGAGEKVEILLQAMRSLRAMVPMDIAREQLRRVSRTLSARHPGLQIVPLWADFTRAIDVPDEVAKLHPRLVFFPGSTIGNFLPPVQRQLLASLAHLAGSDGSLLIGFDRIKEESTLIPAYDDAAGVTRDFEMNILHRLRRELDAKASPEHFRYEARWNDTHARIEMHLVATDPTSIEIDGQRFEFAPGETLWNESSYKYDMPRIEALADSAGLHVARTWSDSKDWFTIALLKAGSRPAQGRRLKNDNLASRPPIG